MGDEGTVGRILVPERSRGYCRLKVPGRGRLPEISQLHSAYRGKKQRFAVRQAVFADPSEESGQFCR